MQKGINFLSKFFSLVLILNFVTSCVPIEKLKYFNDIDELQEPFVNPKTVKLIMPFDKLYIKVFSIDDKTNQLFNSNNTVTSSSTSSIIGYRVDEAGDILYPYTGKINLKDLTVEQAGAKIGKLIMELFSEVSVDVKFIENNVTVLGEVQRQGVQQFSQDKINIYEALALSGGISQFGDRKNVILIRQEGDKIMHHKLDLSDSKIAGKEYYYIQPNDIIVIEPMKSSSWFKFNSANYSTALYTMTFLMSIFFIFKQ
jgi:polysaccharide biosynthesis/export protein